MLKHANRLKKSSVIDLNTKRARSMNQLLNIILRGDINENNKRFIDNSLREFNISKEEFIMTIVGSDRAICKEADRFNEILILGMQTDYDNIVINRLYNTLSSEIKDIIETLNDIDYFSDNEKLKNIVSNLVV